MTNVISSLASPCAGLQVQTSAPFPSTLTQVPDAIAPHQRVSCAISTATGQLHHSRTETDLHRVPKMEGLSHD